VEVETDRMLPSSATPTLNRSTRAIRGALALAATLLLALAAIGCGSSSSSSTTAKATATVPALTKAQFIAQANAICAQGNKTLTASRTALEKLLGGHSPTLAQVNAYVTSAFAPAIQGQLNAIKALGPPKGEAVLVAKMLAIAQEDLERVKANPTLLAGSNSPFASFVKLVHPYGLTKCAATH
jgi:hypothetical protein